MPSETGNDVWARDGPAGQDQGTIGRVAEAGETDPLLPATSKAARRSLVSRFRKHMDANVSRNHGDFILLFSYIVTGLLDSSATAIWGAFVSMQTGNTVYLGLGLASPSSSPRWIKSGISILSFCVGSFCFARLHRAAGPLRRWVLVLGVTIQLLCIAGAALTVQLAPPASSGDSRDLHWHVLVPLALVAFQSSGQAVASRALKFGSLTSVVLTSIYCDLFSDAEMFASLARNAERNRRAAAPVLLLIGAFAGGLWSKVSIGLMGALWTAVVLKAAIIAAWLLWKNEDEGL